MAGFLLSCSVGSMRGGAGSSGVVGCFNDGERGSRRVVARPAQPLCRSERVARPGRQGAPESAEPAGANSPEPGGEPRAAGPQACVCL